MAQNDNSGAFFINEKRQTENHPNYTGSCMVDGKEFRVSIWGKTSKDGKRFWSMSFTPKSEAPQAPAAQTPVPIDDETLPF